MAKQLKGGYLLRYKKKLFGKPWREEWVVLYENSSLVWYKDRDRPTPEGGVLIKEAPELLAVGLWTLRIPARPDLPDNCHTRQLIAVGTMKHKVHWFLCRSEEEVNEWMTAISNTLPAPPTRPRADDVISTPSRFKKTEIINPARNKSTELYFSNTTTLPKTASLGNGLMNLNNSVTLSHQGPRRTQSSGLLTTTGVVGTLVSTGVWSHGFGWGWGPGWGWSGWSGTSAAAPSVASHFSTSGYTGLGGDFGTHSEYTSGSGMDSLDFGASGLEDGLMDGASAGFDFGGGDFGF